MNGRTNQTGIRQDTRRKRYELVQKQPSSQRTIPAKTRFCQRIHVNKSRPIHWMRQYQVCSTLGVAPGRPGASPRFSTGKFSTASRLRGSLHEQFVRGTRESGVNDFAPFRPCIGTDVDVPLGGGDQLCVVFVHQTACGIACSNSPIDHF